MKTEILGMKKSKGTLDNGTAYDTTKVYIKTRFSENENQRGFGVAEYKIGDSREFDKYKHLPFPFIAEVEMEQVTNGKATVTVVTSLIPVDTVKPAAARV